MTKTYSDLPGDGGSDIIGQVESQAARLRERLADVRHVIAVSSGKGGVGKSLIAASLASLLSERGHAVGVLDTDLNGPSIGKILGVRGQDVSMSPEGMVPAIGPNGMRVMSMDLLLPGDETPVSWDGPKHDQFTWRGIMEVSALRELLTDTVWGELSVLVLDLAPGSDRLTNVAGLIPDLAGVIIVTIPSEVSVLAVRKGITVARESKTPVIGLVENMASYHCAHCDTPGSLFRDVDGEPPDLGVPFLGSVPFDPAFATSADRGMPFVLSEPMAPASRALAEIAARVVSYLEEREP